MGHHLFSYFCDETPCLKQFAEERIYLGSQFQKYVRLSWQRILASMSLHDVKMPRGHLIQTTTGGKG